MGEVAIKMSGDEVAISQEELELLEQLGAQYGTETPSLKLEKLALVNKEGDPDFGRWMLGRRRDKETLKIICGREVTHIVIIDVWDQFSYMTQQKGKNGNPISCWSKMYKYGDWDTMKELYGSFYTSKCMECGYRAKDRVGNDKCKGQKVVFCKAILSDGTQESAIMYVSGSSLMPFVNYLKDASILHVGGKTITLPPFGFVTALGSEKKANGAVVYNVARFKRVKMSNADSVKKFAVLADEIHQHVKSQNDKHGNKDDKAKSNVTELPVRGQGDNPFQQAEKPGPSFPNTSEELDDCPFDVSPSVNSGSEGEDDLAAELSAKLGLDGI